MRVAVWPVRNYNLAWLSSPFRLNTIHTWRNFPLDRNPRRVLSCLQWRIQMAQIGEPKRVITVYPAFIPVPDIEPIAEPSRKNIPAEPVPEEVPDGAV